MQTLLMLLCLAGATAQSGFRGLEPGRSTRADVERVLGPAVAGSSDVIPEYPSGNDTQKIFISYGPAAVERIVVVYPRHADREAALRGAGLASQTAPSRVNERGRLEEFFAGANAVLTYAGADADSGVNRVSFYEKGFFDIAAARARPAAQVAAPQPPPPAESRNRPEIPVVRREAGGFLPPTAPDIPPGAMAMGADRDGFVVTEDIAKEIAGIYEMEAPARNVALVVLSSPAGLSMNVTGGHRRLVPVMAARERSPAGESDIFVFGLEGQPKVTLQFTVNRRDPVRVAYMDARGAATIVEAGVRKSR